MTERVPFADPKRAVTALVGDLRAAVDRVLESGSYVLGDQVRGFETELATAFGASSAVGLASGTDAIELAIRALGLKSGAEVVTQANTCVPTVAGIERSGATPVLCDVDTNAGVMDPESLGAAISPRTQAIVPVHLYGQSSTMEPVLALAKSHRIPVIEDCAQSHGSTYRGEPIGTMGAVGCFSFYPTKNLGALGDAGAAITHDEALAQRLRLLRQYGQSDRYNSEIQGVNSRLDELQAAILRVKLPGLDTRNRRREEIAAVYGEALANTAVAPLRQWRDRRHVFHLYVVRCPDRDRFRAEMEHRGVETLIHYPIPIHRQHAYRALSNGPVPLTNAEELAEEIVSLPLFPEMTDSEVARVAQAAAESARTLSY
jgi:dTDP-4-amino-4,6-dideoxygalactose transaminase